MGAYNSKTGAFAGFLQSGGTDIFIPGLWGVEFGDGASQSGPTNVLYFNAGGATHQWRLRFDHGRLTQGMR